MRIIFYPLSILSLTTAYTAPQSRLNSARLAPQRFSKPASLTRLMVATTSDFVGQTIDTNPDKEVGAPPTGERTGAMIDLEGILFSVRFFFPSLLLHCFLQYSSNSDFV